MAWTLVVGMAVAAVSGCGSQMTSYTKNEAPWAAIQRVAVLPFEVPSDNPTRRELVTELFAEELRRAEVQEVVVVPLITPTGGVWNLKDVAKKYQVDGVFSGSVDDAKGTVVHVEFHDAATGDVLWSSTYSLGIRAEFFSLRTQQQQFQKSIRRIAEDFSDEHESGARVSTPNVTP